jgi:hypothetical protein
MVSLFGLLFKIHLGVLLSVLVKTGSMSNISCTAGTVDLYNQNVFQEATMGSIARVPSTLYVDLKEEFFCRTKMPV